jgi:peroxiredoxin
MAQLRQDYAQLAAYDAEVVVVGPEDRKTFEWYWQKEHFAFIGLPDPHEKVTRLFGDSSGTSQSHAGVPELLLIDKDGRVRYTQYRSWAGDSPESELIEMVGNLNQGQ